ncbi:hypothetical protein, partial [Rubrivirga sp.]|uniref:hypothetical protein n=1 Tax=Rubrivirga sp. TaxID=1885344 RepID=UPI003C71AE15
MRRLALALLLSASSVSAQDLPTEPFPIPPDDGPLLEVSADRATFSLRGPAVDDAEALWVTVVHRDGTVFDPCSA